MCCVQVLTIHFFVQQEEAHLLYIAKDPKNKPFTLMHCYVELEKYPKCQTRPVSQKKLKKTSDASPGTTSNDDELGHALMILF